MCCNPKTNYFIAPHHLYAKVEVTKVGHTLDLVNKNLFTLINRLHGNVFLLMWLIYFNITPYPFRQRFN